MSLRVGDLCRIKDVAGVQRILRGRECTIISPLRQHAGYLKHEVAVEDLAIPDGYTVVALPGHLEKLPPPYLAGSWDDCVWKPRGVTA